MQATNEERNDYYPARKNKRNRSQLANPLSKLKKNDDRLTFCCCCFCGTIPKTRSAKFNVLSLSTSPERIVLVSVFVDFVCDSYEFFANRAQQLINRTPVQPVDLFLPR